MSIPFDGVLIPTARVLVIMSAGGSSILPVAPRSSPPGRALPILRVEVPTVSGLAYNLRVSDIMTHPVVSVKADASLLDAVVLLRTNEVSGLPVIDAAGAVVGVLSERDVARILLPSASVAALRGLTDAFLLGLLDATDVSLHAMRQTLEETLVNDAMSRPPLVVGPQAPVELAAEIMRDESVNRLPVVHEARLVGIVTRHDLVRGVFRPGPRRRIG